MGKAAVAAMAWRYHRLQNGGAQTGADGMQLVEISQIMVNKLQLHLAL